MYFKLITVAILNVDYRQFNVYLYLYQTLPYLFSKFFSFKCIFLQWLRGEQKKTFSNTNNIYFLLLSAKSRTYSLWQSQPCTALTTYPSNLTHTSFLSYTSCYHQPAPIASLQMLISPCFDKIFLIVLYAWNTLSCLLCLTNSCLPHSGTVSNVPPLGSFIPHSDVNSFFLEVPAGEVSMSALHFS